jgi:hypothetical protein
MASLWKWEGVCWILDADVNELSPRLDRVHDNLGHSNHREWRPDFEMGDLGLPDLAVIARDGGPRLEFTKNALLFISAKVLGLDLRSLPRSERDLMVSAHNNWLLERNELRSTTADVWTVAEDRPLIRPHRHRENRRDLQQRIVQNPVKP